MIFGSSSNMGIGVAINLRDNFTAKAAAVNASLGRMHRNVRQVMTDNLRAVRNLSLGVAIAGTMLLRPLSDAVRTGSEFRYVMDAVGAVTQDTTRSIEQMSNQVLDISRQTIHTAKELADAEKYLGMAGFKREQIANSIRAVSYLGAATDTMIGGIGGGADILSNVMQQFNVGANQAMRVADLLTATTTRANTNLSQLGEAIYYAGGQFASLDIPLEEILALSGVIAGAGYRGSFAGTGAMNFLQQLTKALGEFRTSRQASVLEQVGLAPKDILTMRNGVAYYKELPDVIDAIAKKLDKGVKGASQIDALFRKRGARAFVAAMRDPKVGMNIRGFTEFLKTGASGKAFDIAQQRMANHYGQMKILQSAWTTFRIKVSDALMPVLMPLITVLTSVANVLIDITSTSVGKWLTVAVIGFGVLATVGAGLLFIFTSIKLMTLSTTVSAANMGKSLTWAWNSAAAAAMRYGLAAKGVTGGMAMNSAGRWFDKSTGRFIKGPASTGMLGGGWFSNFMKTLVGGFGRLASGLVRLVPAIPKLIRAFSGPLGALITIVSVLAGFRNILRAVVYTLGTFLQSIWMVVDAMAGIIENLASPWNWGEAIDAASDKFDQRQKTLGKWLDMNIERDTTGPEKTGRSAKYTQEFASAISNQLQAAGIQRVADKLSISEAEARRGVADGTLNIRNVLQLDGKQVADSTAEYDSMELARLLME